MARGPSHPRASHKQPLKCGKYSVRLTEAPPLEADELDSIARMIAQWLLDQEWAERKSSFPG